MQKRSYFLNGAGIVLSGLLGLSSVGMAQGKTLSDAQIEANVLRALAGAPELATQSIKTTTVYGVVTLSGSVTDESSRSLAETLASKAQGVQKVVDELTLGGVADASNQSAPPPDANQNNGQNDNSQGSNPTLQSDGTMAPPPGAPDGQNPDQSQNQAQAQPQAPEPGYVSPPAPPAEGQNSQQQQYPDNGNNNAQGEPGASPVYRRPYRQPPPAGYGQQGYGQPAPYGAQEAGKAVTIPVGSLVRMRLNEALNSKRLQVGATFDGVVLNDVVADNEIAIPRGAAVQGAIVELRAPGKISGSGELALQLTSVTLGGKTFPIVSDQWTQEGQSNSGRTVGHAIGLGGLGAVLGAVAGGGPGAAIGAVAGAAAGVGVSAAQGQGRIIVPAEAILTFHTTQPIGVTTVSQAEMERLGYGVSQYRMVRRTPPPPPGYYGRPVYYPY